MNKSVVLKITSLFLVAGMLVLTGCGKSSTHKSAPASGVASAVLAAPAVAEAKADPAAYNHAVDCMAATMSRRKVLDDMFKSKGADPMQAFYAGPTWARRMHELAKQNGRTDADAEMDGAKRLGDSNKATMDGHPLFEDAFVIACYNDMPKY